MNGFELRRLLLTGTAAVATIGGGGAALAATQAGTTITNQAQASYTVNGIQQTAQSTVSTFVVDRKVNFTVVSAQAASTKVSVGQIGAVTAFTVTNLTNGAQDFILDPDQMNLSLGVLPGTDNFNVDNMRAFVDGNGNGTYEVDSDRATFIDELLPDTSATVFIVADVPTAQNPDLAFVSLHVIAAAGTTPGTRGNPLLPTDVNIVNQDAEVDIVFADNDSDGLALGDLERNGQGRAYAAYEIGTRSVALTVAKSSRIVSDGVNLLNPKALPGAIVEYCLTVANATLLTAASSIVLTDVVPANTTYVADSITIGGLGAGGVCVLNGFPQRDDGTNTVGPYTGSFNSTTRTVTANIPAVAGGTSLSASFRVVID